MTTKVNECTQKMYIPLADIKANKLSLTNVQIETIRLICRPVYLTDIRIRHSSDL